LLANAKRVYRIADEHHLLLQECTGNPPDMRAHEGKMAVERSDERYCSDSFANVTTASVLESLSVSTATIGRRSPSLQLPAASAASWFVT